MILTRETRFVQNKYGEESLQINSNLFEKQIDPSLPTWVDGKITLNTLYDAVSFIQYG